MICALQYYAEYGAEMNDEVKDQRYLKYSLFFLFYVC